MTTDSDGAGSTPARPERALTIQELVAANLSRVVRWHPGGLHEWSALEWAGAMAGEVGEACNAAKKLKRIDGNIQNINHEAGRSLTERSVATKQIAKEVADTFIYGALLVAVVGEDLEAAIVDVFNKKSEEYGFPERLKGSQAHDEEEIKEYQAAGTPKNHAADSSNQQSDDVPGRVTSESGSRQLLYETLVVPPDAARLPITVGARVWLNEDIEQHNRIVVGTVARISPAGYVIVAWDEPNTYSTSHFSPLIAPQALKVVVGRDALPRHDWDCQKDQADPPCLRCGVVQIDENEREACEPEIADAASLPLQKGQTDATRPEQEHFERRGHRDGVVSGEGDSHDRGVLQPRLGNDGADVSDAKSDRANVELPANREAVAERTRRLDCLPEGTDVVADAARLQQIRERHDKAEQFGRKIEASAPRVHLDRGVLLDALDAQATTLRRVEQERDESQRTSAQRKVELEAAEQQQLLDAGALTSPRRGPTADE